MGFEEGRELDDGEAPKERQTGGSPNGTCTAGGTAVTESTTLLTLFHGFPRRERDRRPPQLSADRRSATNSTLTLTHLIRTEQFGGSRPAPVRAELRLIEPATKTCDRSSTYRGARVRRRAPRCSQAQSNSRDPDDTRGTQLH